MPPKKRKASAAKGDSEPAFSVSSSSQAAAHARVLLEPGGPRKLSLRFGGMIHEEHNMPVYSISFFEPLPDVSQGEGLEGAATPPIAPQFFSSVGSNRATVYKVDSDGSMSVAQAYVDEDAQETFYATCWTSTVANTPLLLLAGYRGLIKVLDCQNGELRTTLVGHGNAVNELRVHPINPALVLSASKDESIRLWNVYSCCCVAIFAGDQGHRDEVLSLDVHLLGHCFCSCGMDNTVKVWSLEGPSPSRRLAKNIDLSFSYDAHTGRCSSDGGDGVKRNGGGGAVQSEADAREAVKGPLSALLLDEQRTQGLGGGGGGGVRFQTLHEQFPVFSTAHVHSDYVDCVRWVGNLILSKSTASKVVMWKPDVFSIHGHPGTAVAASPPAANADDDTAAASSSPTQALDGIGGVGGGSAASSGDSASGGGAVPAAGAVGGFTATATAAAAAEEKTSGGESGSSSSSSAESSTESSNTGSSPGGAVEVTALAALPPMAGAVEVLREFEFKDADIWFVRFALDPALQILAVGNKHGRLWVWNVDGTPAAPLVKNASHAKCQKAIRQTAFSPDRRYLLCCCEDGSIWKWALDFA